MYCVVYFASPISLQSEYQDPRVVFVLVKPAAGSPPLTSSAYEGATMNASLQSASAAAIGNPVLVEIDHDARRIQLSPLFDQYQAELGSWLSRRTGRKDPRMFEILLSLADERGRRLLNAAVGYPIGYGEFNWTLNAYRPPEPDILAPYRKPLYFGPMFNKPKTPQEEGPQASDR